MAALNPGIDCYAPIFTVTLIEKNEILEKDSTLSVDVDENLESPGMFTLSMNEGIDINTQKFKWLDDNRISPGQEISIAFRYATSQEKQVLIRGRIKALTPGFLSTGIPTLKVEGYDLSHDLQKTQGDLSYSEVTYSKIAEAIAKDNGLKSKTDSTKIVHVKIKRKKNEKDYALLKRLAKEIGFEFFVRDKTLYFREPRDNKKGEITFEFRKNFISFNPRMTTATLVNEVQVTAWNEKEKKTISETASIKDIKSSVGIPDFDRIVEKSQGKKVKVKIEGRVVRSAEEAKSLARAELKRRNNGFIEGTLECIGDPQLRPGITVNIEKVGNRFKGVYYVTKAKHSIDDGGYKTTLTVRRSVL